MNMFDTKRQDLTELIGMKKIAFRNMYGNQIRGSVSETRKEKL